MITTIEQLKELVDNTDNMDSPVITYAEWTECLKSLLAKIDGNEQFNYRGTGSLILFTDVSEMSEEEQKDYDYYCAILRKFFGLYGYGHDGTPKDCWTTALNNPDIAIEPEEYRPLK